MAWYDESARQIPTVANGGAYPRSCQNGRRPRLSLFGVKCHWGELFQANALFSTQFGGYFGVPQANSEARTSHLFMLAQQVLSLSRRALRVACKRCYHVPMRRLLTLFMVFTLVIANGTSVAGALCRHQSMVDHSAARKSDDARVSGAAFSEEAVASVTSKKGALADAGAVAWIADLPPGPQFTVPVELNRRADLFLAGARPLAGRSLAPLLEPPAA